jgi:hypothetical protein
MSWWPVGEEKGGGWLGDAAWRRGKGGVVWHAFELGGVRWPARRAVDGGGRCQVGSDRGLDGVADRWARVTIPAV